VKNFDPKKGDPSYTMSIVELLLECVELSYRHGMYQLIVLFWWIIFFTELCQIMMSLQFSF